MASSVPLRSTIRRASADPEMLTDEAGFDAAIDYKSKDVQARLKDLCPKGIDIFFDNVGGDALDAAPARLAMRGRVVLCGAIANYNATEPPPGPKTTST
jgi:NADPH-dependent curcumin reductase CurA